MSKTLNLKLAGLWPSPNPFTTVPGALDVADDVVIDQKDLGQSRRGFETFINNDGQGLDGFPLQTMLATVPNSSAFDLLTYRINEGTQDGRLLLEDRDTISGDNRFLPPPDARRPRMLNWGKYIYVTSNEGIKRYSPALNSSVSAGIPQALDLVLTLDGTSGFLTSNEVGTVSVTVTDGSPTLTDISDEDIQKFFIGQVITGTGIVAGTTVQDITFSTPAVIYPATLVGASADITVSASTGIAVGQLVSGEGIQTDSRVTAIAGGGPYTITLSLPVIETATAVSVTFSTDNTVTMSQNASIMAGPATETLSLSNGSQIAYRLVWGLRNENEAIMLGVPSSFTVISNTTGGTRNVKANASIPDGISTDNFYQLYRSVATPTSSIVPADQMQLVAEGVPSSGDISAGFIEITDQTPDSLKGEALYTGTDVEGILQANYPPPTASDMALFRGYMLYADVTAPHQLKLIMDGVGAPSGIQIGDEIAITTDSDMFTVTAAASEDTTVGEFAIVTGGTPAQNIADTAASFIRVINRYPVNEILYAYLLSGPNDLPGQILLEARAGIGEFEVTASANGTAWTPDIVSPQASKAENTPNGILIAKAQEPEAVPRANLRLAGGIGNKIKRIVPLRDYVIVVTVGGVYRLTGQSIDDFQVEPFDLTVQIVAPETCVALGNECWGLSTQGVVSISDGGVRIRSALQINSVLQSLIRQAPNSVRDYAFAVGYESDQRYILSLPDSEGDTVCTQQYCYNYIIDTWVRWTRVNTAGYVNATTGLYFGNGLNANVVLERKTGGFTDYVDESIFVQITAASGLEITLSSIADLVVGDILWQNQSGVIVYAEIIEIDFASSMVTVSQEITWTVGTATEDTRVLPAINCVFQWIPEGVGDPTEAKQYSEGQFVFRTARFSNATASFATDISSGFAPVELLGQVGGGWGLFPWGESPWGGVLRPKTLRFYVPQDKQYAGVMITRLVIRSGYSQWALEGASFTVYDISGELGSPGGAS